MIIGAVKKCRSDNGNGGEREGEKQGWGGKKGWGGAKKKQKSRILKGTY